MSDTAVLLTGKEEKRLLKTAVEIDSAAVAFHVRDQLEFLSRSFNVEKPSFTPFKSFPWPRKRIGQYDSAKKLITIPVMTSIIDYVVAHEFTHHLGYEGFLSEEDNHNHSEEFYELLTVVFNRYETLWETSPRRKQFGLD